LVPEIIFRTMRILRLILTPLGLLLGGLAGFLPALAQVPKAGEVKMWQGRPTIFVNGQPQTPAFYALTHAYGGRWSWEEVPARNLRNFCGAGYRLFQVDLYLEDIWYQGADSLDLAKVRRQVGGVVAQCPDAAVVIRVHVNAPFWWNRAHPEECTHFMDGPVDTTLHAGPPFHNEEHDIGRALRASLASEKWKTEAGQKLVELCQRLARTPEGNAVVGMHLSGGIYGEWHYWGFIKHEPDGSQPMTRYFRQWLKKKYGTDQALQKAWRRPGATLATAAVPGPAERLATQDGMFKDPARDLPVIDYFTAQQEVVADDAIYFCQLAKQNWPRPLITGIFYGYLHMTFNRQTVGGHLFIKEIMESPAIDYLAAPQTYWEASRKAGGSGISRGIVESALLHGKLWLDEIDNGYLHPDTGRDNIRYSARYDTTFETVQKRSERLPLLRGIGFWYYDFGLQKGFGWWDSPQYLANIKATKQLFDQRLQTPHRSEADVLYVWSQDAFYYVKPGWTPLSMNVPDLSAEQAMRAGVVGDHVYDFDLPLVKLDQYKAVVFMNVYKLTAEQRKFIRARVATGGRTLVWNYLTGYTDGQKLSLDFVKELTGVGLVRVPPGETPVVQFAQPSYTYKLDAPVEPMVVVQDAQAQPLATRQGSGEVVVAQKSFPNFRSVVCALPLNGSDGFRQILRQAGCHVYNEQNDFTYAHSGLLLLHTASGGERVLRLRSGREVKLTLERGATLLLDAQTGEVVLR
jgi:hypothetical protein